MLMIVSGLRLPGGWGSRQAGATVCIPARCQPLLDMSRGGHFKLGIASMVRMQADFRRRRDSLVASPLCIYSLMIQAVLLCTRNEATGVYRGEAEVTSPPD